MNLKNNLPNGKRIKYYSNDNILYEGEYFNGKFEEMENIFMMMVIILYINIKMV